MIQGLPPDGARARALNGHHWGDLEHLVAIVADRIGQVGAGTLRALGAKGVRAPKPLPRPGKKNPDGKTIGNRGGRTTAEALAFLHSLDPPKALPPAVHEHQAAAVPPPRPRRRRVRAVRVDRPDPTT